MNKPSPLARYPKIGEKVKQDGIEYKITAECMGIYYGKVKYSREDVELDLSKIEYLEGEKLSKKDLFIILEKLIKEETLKREKIEQLKLFGRLRKKYPDISFWRDYFEPKYKVAGLLWYFGNGASELELEYKKFTLDLSLTGKPEKVIIGDVKVGNDLKIEKKPKNLLELLR
jgi:hypothetical protein